MIIYVLKITFTTITLCATNYLLDKYVRHSKLGQLIRSPEELGHDSLCSMNYIAIIVTKSGQ